MSGFLLLHWSPEVDAARLKHMGTQGTIALGQSHPLAPSQHFSELSSDGFRCIKLDTDDSQFSSVFKDPNDGSWIFVVGAAGYAGKRVIDSTLPSLLAKIRENPTGVSKDISGVFVAVAFDNLTKKAFVVPSAIGEFSVYVRKNEQGVIGISTSVLALAAMGPVTLDEFTCHSLYRIGHRMPPNTIFNEIQSVHEGSLLEVGGGRCETRRYWTPFAANPPRGTLADTAEEIAELLTEYCTSLIEPGMPVASDMTGGYDSRVTNACLLRAGIRFLPTITGLEDNPDVILARQIASGEGLPLLVINALENPSSFPQDIRASVKLTEANLDTTAFVITLRTKRAVFSKFAKRPVQAVSGTLGECCRDFIWYQEFFDRGKVQPASIEKVIRYRIDARPSRMDLFANDWHSDWRSQLHRYLEGVAEPFKGERNTTQLDAIYIRKMDGMMAGFTTAMARWSSPIVPFFSTAALDRSLTVPPEWRYRALLLRQICKSLSPKLSRYMTQYGCPCEPATVRNWYRFLPKGKAEFERVCRKASTVFMGKTLFPEYVEPRPAINPYADLVRQESGPGGHLNFESMETAGWYSPDTLKGLVKIASTPEGYDQRRAVMWIYTCEAMSRLARAHAPHQVGIAA